jgi:DUF971 family protein
VKYTYIMNECLSITELLCQFLPYVEALNLFRKSMGDGAVLTDLERSDEDCVLRFNDGLSYKLSYVSIRSRCQCAKCKPRQENEQRTIELEEEISRLMLEKPKVELVGRYGIRFEWPTGCSSGIHSFTHLRKVSEELGQLLDS